MGVNVIHEHEPGPGTLGKPELYALAIGQVIGAGVITLIVPAIKMTGYSAWLAYFLAVLIGFIMVLPIIFVTGTVRLGGGNYSMLCDLAGPSIAGVFAYTLLIQTCALALFGTAAAAYIGDVIPALGTPINRRIVGILLLTFFYVVNLKGVDLMAKVQKLMTWILIASLLIFAIVGIAKIKLPIFDFSHPEFLTQGWTFNLVDGKITGGFLGAVLLFVYSCQGYYMTMAYGRDSRHATRDIPYVMFMAVPTLIVLYVGVAIAATGSLSIAEYGDSTTLVYAARSIFPTWLYYAFIIGGPIMALLSTLNSNFAYNAITIGQSCDDGWLPEKFGRKNKNGARHYVLTFSYIASIIPIVFGLSITVIVNIIQLITAVISILNVVAFWNLPKRYRNSWNASKYKVPDWLYYFICVLSTFLFVVVFVKSCLSMNKGLAIGFVALFIILGVLGVYKSKVGNITVHTSVWSSKKEAWEENLN